MKMKKSRLFVIQTHQYFSSLMSVVYDSLIQPLDETLPDGRPFFRKKLRSGYEIEHVILSVLKWHPHPNIVDVYEVTEDYVDIELVDCTKRTSAEEIVSSLMEAKSFLQSLGIYYCDWHMDQVGISDEGQVKLFDFDNSMMRGVSRCRRMKRIDDSAFSMMIDEITGEYS